MYLRRKLIKLSDVDSFKLLFLRKKDAFYTRKVKINIMAVIFSGKEKRLIRVVVLLTSQKSHHEKNSVVDIFYL